MKVHSSLYDTKYQQFDKKSVTITIDKELNQYISIFSYVIGLNIDNCSSATIGN